MNKFVLLLIVGALVLSGCAGMAGTAALVGGKEQEFVDKHGRTAFATMNFRDMSALCSSYMRVGDLQGNIDCNRAYLKRFSNDNDLTTPVFVSGQWTQLALALLNIGDNEAALKESDAGIKHFISLSEQPSSFWVSTVDNLKGSIANFYQIRLAALIRLERIDEANQAMELLKEMVPWANNQNKFVRDPFYLNIAQAYWEMKEYEQASNMLKVNSKHTSSRDVALNLMSFGMTAIAGGFFESDMSQYFIAKADLESGRIVQAQKLFKAIELKSSIKKAPQLYWVFLKDYGQLYLTLKQPHQAIDKLIEAVQVIESYRSFITSEQNKINFAGNKQEVYSLLVKILMSQKRYDEAFAYAERGKARALVDMLASKKKFSGGNVISSSEQNQLLAQLDAAEAKARVIGDDQKQISSTRSVVIKSRSTLMQQAPELSSLVTVAAPDVKEIQNLLPKGETLIEYYGSGDHLFAFVVNKNGIQGVKLNAADLDNSVTTFREAILDVTSDAYKREGNKLYQQIIAPVISGISTKNITIVPHGALHYVPFSALANSHGFLIDQYNLRILPSASVMKFLKKNKNKAGSLLAFGNPDLGDAKYDLPFAQKEAEMIAAKTKGAKLLVRGQATETAVKTYGNSFRYLHFASHGTFDAEKPLNSGLLLAKDAQNDGMLTVGELYDLNLNADLVTLSACETALGKIANGDDVVGFTRGFLYAGASSIVSSLWQVDDAATSILMQNFYDNLGNQDKRSALRDAQLSTKAKYHHPYYWAAFQITGAVD